MTHAYAQSHARGALTETHEVRIHIGSGMDYARVHCTLYTVQCTSYNVHCTSYTAHRTPPYKKTRCFTFVDILNSDNYATTKF